jgi:transposase
LFRDFELDPPLCRVLHNHWTSYRKQCTSAVLTGAGNLQAFARSWSATTHGMSLSTRFIAGFLHAGKRAAAIMSLIRSAQLSGHDPYVYLKDVLTRLPTHRAADIDESLPHRWKPHANAL